MRLLTVVVLVVLLYPGAASAQHYMQTNLVSDIPGAAATFDPNLVNAWGVTRSATSPWWVGGQRYRRLDTLFWRRPNHSDQRKWHCHYSSAKEFTRCYDFHSYWRYSMAALILFFRHQTESRQYSSLPRRMGPSPAGMAGRRRFLPWITMIKAQCCPKKVRAVHRNCLIERK
jgi:hypothetical protein